MSKPTPVIMGTDGEPIVDPTGDRPTDLELCAVHLLLAAFHYAGHNQGQSCWSG